VCLSVRCPAKVRGNLTRWIEVLDIVGLGESFVADVAARIQDPAQLYALELDDLLHLPGYQLTKAKKAYAAIHRVKRLPLAQFLTALNIPEAGRSTWDAIVAAGYSTIEKIQTLTPQDLEGVTGIGMKTAKRVLAGIRSKSKVVEDLLAVGIVPEPPRSGPLEGLSFCFTGSLPSGMSRPVAQKIVQRQGGMVKSTVGKGLTYLVQANKKSTSTKTQKANKYGVKIINEEEFLDLAKFDLDLLDQLY
jgi:DNA ligase (NAD+)